MITSEKLKIYNRYGGDIDGLSRTGFDYGKVFEDHDWSLIEGFYQDIELINKGLTSKGYICATVRLLKEKCDKECFNELVDHIKLYHNFKRVAEILHQIKNYCSNDVNVVWTHFNSGEEFLKELDQDITSIEMCDFLVLDKMRTNFLPTCTYQEIAISSGWGDEYLELASEFDEVFKKLNAQDA